MTTLQVSTDHDGHALSLGDWQTVSRLIREAERKLALAQFVMQGRVSPDTDAVFANLRVTAVERAKEQLEYEMVQPHTRMASPIPRLSN